ncbi:MAG: hypothetical protein M1840_000972 [Geoglossum simile]|nr:MAG: hypothetical protein M1840_000972 [Geoglossum simile]
MGNGPLPPKRQPSWELADVSDGHRASSAGNTKAYTDRSTDGPQTSTEAPAIVTSSDIRRFDQGLEPQITPHSTDSQHQAPGGHASPGALNVTNAIPPPYTQSQGPGGAFDMGDMSWALHDYNLLSSMGQHHGQLHQQRFPSSPTSASAPALVYQAQPEISHLTGQSSVSYHNSRTWPLNYQQQYQPMYQPYNAAGSDYPQFVQPHQVQPLSLNPAQSLYTAQWLSQQPQPQQSANSYAYSPAPYCVSGQSPLPGYSVGSHPLPSYPAPYMRRLSLPVYQGSAPRLDGEYEGIYPRGAANSGYRTGNPLGRSESVPSKFFVSMRTRFGLLRINTIVTDISSGINSSSGSSNLTGVPSSPLHSSMLRGPPRKPKQTGHALWVGNLPPGTNVVDLKDYFSREATADIESVFLISKSNCAFVNYKSETACASAMSRFHDSRFQGVKLVCRLRKGSATPPASTPIGPSSSTPAISEYASQPSAAQSSELQAGEDVPVTDGVPKEELERPKDRYFIVKSLTVEDLDISVKNGTWATQTHNEKTLNKAFESSESVYLIFSANKSGEYYGYARMASPISGELSSLTANWIPRTQVVENTNLPRAIATPATKYAPKGRIIDDSARGTIFWETYSDSDDILTSKDGQDNISEKSEDSEDGMAPNKSWGKPFKIEWISTTRLPFYRTRGLRNLWNANREIKIARDGTELETSVGRRLITMFHRSTPSPAGAGVAAVPALQAPVGYHQARQF